MDQKAEKFPGSEDVIGSPDKESAVRPGTAHTVAGEEKSEEKTSLVVMPEPKAEVVDEEKQQKVKKPEPPAKKKGPVVSRLNQYAMYDKNHPLNQPFPAIENFKGPKSIISIIQWREKPPIF